MSAQCTKESKAIRYDGVAHALLYLSLESLLLQLRWRQKVCVCFVFKAWELFIKYV